MTIEKIPLSYRGKYIQGYRCGRGSDVIVFLQGSGVMGALSSWEGVMTRLAKKATVYTLDLPGYGASDPLETLPEEGFYPYYHHCLEAAIDQLKLDRFVLVGLSMGGAIAIRYALEHPEQVCGLVPVSSWGLAEKSPSHYFSSFVVHRTSWIRKFCQKVAQSPLVAKWYLQSILFGRKSSVTSDIVEEIMGQMQKESIIDSLEYFQKSSVTPRAIVPYFGDELSKLKMPVLLIQGKRDPLIPRSHGEKAARIITNCRLHILLSCRHWCCKEQPELFYQALWAFVKRDCLFSYKNMLPQKPVAEKAEAPVEAVSAAPEENVLHRQLKARWEKRRRAVTKLRLCSDSSLKRKERARKALYKK